MTSAPRAPRAPAPGVPLAHYSPFGSVFKKHIARALWQLARAEGGGLAMTRRKRSFGPDGEVLTFRVALTPAADDPLRIERAEIVPVPRGDASLVGIGDSLPARQRVLQAVAESPGNGAEAYAKDLDLAPKTVSDYLSALKGAGDVVNREGKWWPVDHRREGEEVTG